MNRSKRSGLEKAIFQVEEAIKKRKSESTTDQNTLQHLRQLLSEASHGEDHVRRPSESSPSPVEEHNLPVKETTATSSDDHLAIEGVENPLQLLARASDLRIATPHTYDHSSTTADIKLDGSVESAYLDVHHFFLPMKASLDQGPGLDPIDVGLVTMEEAEMLLQ